MQILSQNDPRWKYTILGTSRSTIGQEGCAITCVAMLAGTTPDQVNAKMPFIEGNLLVWNTVASQWGLETHNPIMDSSPAFYPTIAHVKLSGYDHYVVVDADGTQYDPWDGTIQKNKYQIIDYRNITNGGNMASTEYNELVNRLNIDESARRFEQGRTDNLVITMRGVTANLDTINATLKQIATSEPLQDSQLNEIQKAVDSASEQLKIAINASPALTADQLEALGAWQGLWASIKNIFHIK